MPAKLSSSNNCQELHLYLSQLKKYQGVPAAAVDRIEALICALETFADWYGPLHRNDTLYRDSREYAEWIIERESGKTGDPASKARWLANYDQKFERWTSSVMQCLGVHAKFKACEETVKKECVWLKSELEKAAAGRHQTTDGTRAPTCSGCGTSHLTKRGPDAFSLRQGELQEGRKRRKSDHKD